MSNEIGETFKDLRHAGQSKREHNRRYSTKLLSSRRIKFHIRNNGYHLIIYEIPETIINFWPSTGLWKVQGDNTKHRGIKTLLEYIESHGLRSTDSQK